MLSAGSLAACGDAAADDTGVADALCRAIAAEDAATASEVFEQDVHGPLHTVADEVGAVDRAIATRLLEAKFAVETVVRGDTEAPTPLVRQRLEDLAVETRAALDALGRPAPGC